MPNDAESLTDADVDDQLTDSAAGEALDADFDATQAHAVVDTDSDDEEPSSDLDEPTMAVDAVELDDVADAQSDDTQDDALSPDDLVTVEDLGGDDDFVYDNLVTVEDLGGEDSDAAEGPYPDQAYHDDGYDDGYDDEEYDDQAVLFDGDPEDFELDLGVAAYPDTVGQPGDMMVLDEPGLAPRPAPRRMSRMERRRRVRLQARRVRRIIRHVEPWSVLKISLFFYACLWVIFLVAGFIVWGVAESSGTVEQIEDLITDLFALDSFDFDAGQIMRGYALGGLALSIAGTTFNVLMCLLFNLISDLTGGLRITMIEEETARPTPPRRRRRRPPPRR